MSQLRLERYQEPGGGDRGWRVTESDLLRLTTAYGLEPPTFLVGDPSGESVTSVIEGDDEVVDGQDGDDWERF